ncbi:MAG: cation:proton antiporter [Actinomycetota bacterium]
MSTESLLGDIAIIFVAAKLVGALFERFRQPAVIGEVLIGVLLGPHVLDLIGHTSTHELLQELGAIILLFAVGLDTPLSDLRAVGGRSFAVGTAGIVLPFAAGALLLLAAGHNSEESLFVGTAMVATSVGVTARVLADIGRVRAPESRVILGAAVVDDVLGLLVLAVVAGSVTDDLSPASVIGLAILALGFVALVGGLGARAVKHITPVLDRLGDIGVFTVAIGACLVLSAVADALDLAAIIGAFLAGMAFAETHDRYHVEERLSGVYSVIVPFFFVITGAALDPDVLTSADTAWLALGVTVVAIVGKLVGCGVAAAGMGRRSALIVGTGMVPRGEVGILVASIGLERGIVEGDLYAVVVVMAVATTLVAPPVLSALFEGIPGREPRGRGPRGPDIEGIGG